MMSDLGSEQTQAAPKSDLAETIAAFDQPSTGAPVAEAEAPAGAERYTVGEVLGRGGMGTVYVARDGQFGRDVALKQMSYPDAGRDATRRFAIEALVTANLEHPGIPPVYERGQRDGRAYYTMRKVTGETLAQAVERAGGFDERLRLLPIVVQVAHTLGFAHERGVVHRDVKPDNVIVGTHGEAVLLDWGIAHVRGTAWTSGEAIAGESSGLGAGNQTADGAVVGTPAYMAPEQAGGELDHIDARTDVFALGAMLYHVLSGIPPYAGPNRASVLVKAMEGTRPPLRKVAPKTPPELREILDIAMAQDPEDRYPNAGAFADAVQGFLTHAVRRRPSPLIRALGHAAGVGTLLLAVIATILITSELSSFAEQGWGAYAYVALTVISCLIGAIEWRTRGRHHLGVLVLAFAGCTVLAGFSAAIAGFGQVVRTAAERAEAERIDLLLDGLWEISGSIPLAANLAAIQLLVWAVGRRARLLAAEDTA